MLSQSGNVVVVTHTWDGLGLGLLMKSQGSKVTFAFDFKDLKEKELEEAKCCGDGLVERLPLAEAIKKFGRTGALWVFDNNEFPKVADKLRQDAEEVIGTSELAAKLENDRQYAAKLAKSVGFELCETEEFTDYSLGIKFLQKNRGKAYVFKPYDAEAEATFVPGSHDDPATANEELQNYLATVQVHSNKRPRFLLQEKLQGLEVNYDLWVSNGRPLVAFCDLEAKRKVTGDLGENIGCAGDFLFKLPILSKGIQQTVARYLKLPEVRNYTGTVDVNVMIAGEKFYFLENCFRFGYNAYPTIFYGLALRPTEEIIRKWIRGEPIEQAFSNQFAASLTLLTGTPAEGQPILLKNRVSQRFSLYAAYKDGDHLSMAGPAWPNIGCIVESAGTMDSAAKKCLSSEREVVFPNKYYRIDLADSDLNTLPIARYRKLQTLGLLR